MDYAFIISKILIVHAFLHAIIALLLIRGVLWGDKQWRRYLGAAACAILAISALGGLEATMTDTRQDFFWPLLLGRIGGTLWAAAVLVNHWEVIRRPLLKSTMFEFLLPQCERY